MREKKKVLVPGGTRTPNPQIRSLMRYPLRHWDELTKVSTTGGFEPPRAKPINLAG